MSEAVGGGSCFTGLICNQNLSHSCKHDEPEPDCRLAVNSNLPDPQVVEKPTIFGYYVHSEWILMEAEN